MGRRLRDLAERAIRDAQESGDPLNYRERYALLALANFLKDKRGETWTSDARIAKRVHMSADGYYRARLELMRRGLMEHTKGGGQGFGDNEYRMFPSSAESAGGTSADSAEDVGGVSEPTSADTTETSADTTETSADTTETSADTTETSADTADRSLITLTALKDPSTYVASASPPRDQNRSMKIVEDGEAITDGIAAAVVANIDGPPLGEDFSEDHRRAEIDRLREASSDA
jgi:hypothetical protein